MLFIYLKCKRSFFLRIMFEILIRLRKNYIFNEYFKVDASPCFVVGFYEGLNHRPDLGSRSKLSQDPPADPGLGFPFDIRKLEVADNKN